MFKTQTRTFYFIQYNNIMGLYTFETHRGTQKNKYIYILYQVGGLLRN